MGETRSYYMEPPELAILARWARALDRSQSWVLRELVLLGDAVLAEREKKEEPKDARR